MFVRLYADCKLFARITGNGQRLLHLFLPSEREHQYTLRQRSHNFQLPNRTSVLKDKNFIIIFIYLLITPKQLTNIQTYKT